VKEHFFTDQPLPNVTQCLGFQFSNAFNPDASPPLIKTANLRFMDSPASPEGQKMAMFYQPMSSRSPIRRVALTVM
jgi:hypothetical protein